MTSIGSYSTPADRDRQAALLDVLRALRSSDAAAFDGAVARLGLLPASAEPPCCRWSPECSASS